MTAWLSLAYTFFKAFPAARDILFKLFDEYRAYDKARNEKEAAERLAAKDAAIDAVFNGVLGSTRPTEQQPKVDAAPAIHERGSSGS